MPKPRRSRPGSRAPRVQSGPRMLSTNKVMRKDPIYTVTKRVYGLAIHVTSTVIETFSTSGLSLNSFTGYASLTGAFDQYRIDLVEFEYLPRTTTGDGVSTNPGIFVSVVDQDDLSNLSSVNEALAYPNAQVYIAAPDKMPMLKHRFQPRIAVAAYGGAFTKFANLPPQWIDAANADVVHYGVKCASSITSTVLTYDILITAQISFRGGRA